MCLLWLGIWIGILCFLLPSRAQHRFLGLKDISYQLNGTSSHQLVVGFALYHKREIDNLLGDDFAHSDSLRHSLFEFEPWKGSQCKPSDLGLDTGKTFLALFSNFLFNPKDGSRPNQETAPSLADAWLGNTQIESCLRKSYVSGCYAVAGTSPNLG